MAKYTVLHTKLSIFTCFPSTSGITAATATYQQPRETHKSPLSQQYVFQRLTREHPLI